jgi:hypothetical protein
LDAEYERGEEIDYSALFRLTKITNESRKLFHEIENDFTSITEILTSETVPSKKIGLHCESPYPCDFKGTCWKEFNECDLAKIGGLDAEKKAELFNSGKRDFSTLSKNNQLGNRIQIQIQSHIHYKKLIDKDKLCRVIEKLTGNLSYFDLEACNPILPLYIGDKPYGMYPFLYVYDEGNTEGEVKFYISEPESDNRYEFAKNLIENTYNAKTIVVFDPGYENAIISNLQHRYPNLKADLEIIRGKFFDISIVLKNAVFYHPSLMGGFSLKSLFNLYLNEEEKKKLTINAGLGAAFQYEKLMMNPNLKEINWKDPFIQYCIADVRVTRIFTEDLIHLSKEI